MLRIEVLNNKKKFVLREGSYRFGRGAENDVCLHHLSISKNHFMIDVEDGEWFIRDLESTNGTEVNGESLTKRIPLVFPAVIQAGHVVIQAVDIDPEDVVESNIQHVPLNIEIAETTHSIRENEGLSQKATVLFQDFFSSFRRVEDFFHSPIPGLFSELKIEGYGIVLKTKEEYGLHFSLGRSAVECLEHFQPGSETGFLPIHIREDSIRTEWILAVVPFELLSEKLFFYVLQRKENFNQCYFKQLEKSLLHLSRLIYLTQKSLDKSEKGKRKIPHSAGKFFRCEDNSEHGLFISASMKAIRDEIRTIAHSDANVIIEGETGVGKEVVARLIHFYSNKKGQFIPVVISTRPHDLIESELFGFKKGSFSGAFHDKPGSFVSADNGTIFLDEIADMPLEVQAKLLRALDDGEVFVIGSAKPINVDVRVIAASNIPFSELIAANRLRKDLYYRLNGFKITIPPLRERKEDIFPLFLHFLNGQTGTGGCCFRGITKKAHNALESYYWPGNVRELYNEAKRVSAIMDSDGIIYFPMFSEDIKNPIPEDIVKKDSTDIKESVNSLEKEMIIKALRKCKGNKSEAARIMNLSRSGLEKKIKRLNIFDIE